ncbi:HD domain-containing protein [Candidatus Woesearchaeota archaeon]|nr:HD domain-containing protein [Candidatus Woesearchaeota archaeon]
MKKITNFLFELGQLNRVKRSGYWLINIRDPESVAEHNSRTTQIAFILAKLENVDPYKTAAICAFHDIHETRLNDLHKVGHRYIDFRKAEKKAFAEQMENLPKEIADELTDVYNQYRDQSSKEGIVARDADLLDNALSAKELIEKGNKDAQNWIDNIKKVIKTESGKKLLIEIEKTSSNEWWKNLKKIER